jgi:hypothetical protein
MVKCPECNRQKYVIRSMQAGKRICIECNLKFPLNWQSIKRKRFNELKRKLSLIKNN